MRNMAYIIRCWCETGKNEDVLVTRILRLEAEPSMSVSILSVNFSISRTCVRVVLILWNYIFLKLCRRSLTFDSINDNQRELRVFRKIKMF